MSYLASSVQGFYPLEHKDAEDFEKQRANRFYTVKRMEALKDRDITADLCGALMEAKESIEGKRKLNTLDSLINDIQTLKTEGKL